jgi:hypothetical protein
MIYFRRSYKEHICFASRLTAYSVTFSTKYIIVAITLCTSFQWFAPGAGWGGGGGGGGGIGLTHGIWHFAKMFCQFLQYGATWRSQTPWVSSL